MDKKIVYIDGVFDLFHRGHLESFKKAKNIYSNTYLIVGILSDKCAKDYKRLPIICEDDRYEIIKNLKIVDEIIEDPPLIISKEFMDKYKIDLIVHGFANENDANKQQDFFTYPKKIGKFKSIEYYSKLSTTDIINKITKHTLNS
ncbi:Cytidylyltransferase-like [seawater metagenome]|uniref:choline-phosphate cytidylyltransferase n=1 Tax=seawater metagenome TaxID=1561972 RepID=A0A5E8CJJ3_9ZZZZ